MSLEYTIRKTAEASPMAGDWEGRFWQTAPPLEIASFHPKSSSHHPRTQARLLYNDAHLFVIFRVEDRFVRCVHQGFQQPVCTDSCVEFFVAPKAGPGYFNFETNCGGAMLTRYNLEATATQEASKTDLADEWMRKIERYHSMPETVDPEIEEPVTWIVELGIPFSLFEAQIGSVAPRPGLAWRGNLYKCGDGTSHPHWGSWNPIGEKLSFHQPSTFGRLRFES